MDRLAEEAPAKAASVHLRIFAGMSRSRAVRKVGTARATAGRDWSFAKVQHQTLTHG
jgi:hypothetical protein